MNVEILPFSEDRVNIIQSNHILTALKEIPPNEDLILALLDNTLQTDDLSMYKFLVNSLVLCHLQMSKAHHELIQKVTDRVTIDETHLANLFYQHPNLLSDFEVRVEDSVKVIYYKGEKGSGKRNDAYMSTAFNVLQSSLIDYIGTKNVTHSILAKAIIKWSDWETVKPKTLSRAELIEKIINRAEYLIYEEKKSKITIPLIKKDPGLKDFSSREMLQILKDYGWEVVTLKTSRTKYLRPKNFIDIKSTTL